MPSARVLILNTTISYPLPVHHLPDYMRERVALMKLRHGEYPTGVADRLRQDMGVWIGSKHLLLSLTRTEYSHLISVAQAIENANPRRKSKRRSEENIGEAQRVLFPTSNWWVRAFWSS